MLTLQEHGKTFKNYKYARYATDVTFQQSNRPTGNMQEGKKYFSGKHKLYGYKTEVSVLRIGLAINYTAHYPGSVSDIDIFKNNINFHKKALIKEFTVDDFGELSVEFPLYWAILLDKGYQGIKEFIRAIHPKKKPQNSILLPSDVRYNHGIS